jgi:CRISPR-associated protein (TIGR02710 family)
MTAPLLLATVGGAPEPLVASLLHWRPGRVVFIVTPQTRDSVARDIVPKVQAAGWPDFDPGRYDLHEVPDAQDYLGLVNELRCLDDRVVAWRRDHPDVGIIADFTGGTKAMSTALALVAARWPCCFSYVGGTQRTKEGVGIVVSGKEQVIQSHNPADTLALLALDTALALLRTHAFGAADQVLQGAQRRVTDPARKAELGAVSLLAQALADWDRFQHQDALHKLRVLPQRVHNLEVVLGHGPTQALLTRCAALQRHLEALLKAKTPDGALTVSRELILDLLANARRRLDEHRWDDATARLYRALEATAQLHLKRHDICDTGWVPLDQIPEPLRHEWTPRVEDDHLRLGLHDAWRLLQAFDAPTAAPFFQTGLADRQKSPLTARNQSILAHGFAPVSQKAAEALLDAALRLLGATETDLPASPATTLAHPALTP